MLEINPIGICSWNLELSNDQIKIFTSHTVFGESGHFYLNSKKFEIEKKGSFSPTWHIHSKGSAIARVTKPSAFSRTFEIRLDEMQQMYTLSASSLFGREMLVVGPQERFCITPVHPFTRRSVIKEEINNPTIVAIALWFTTLLWRRQASNA